MYKQLNNGIDIPTTSRWLNTSPSYCYRLVKKGDLETVSTDPLSIAPKSVIEFIGRRFPTVTDTCFSRLDYELKQELIHV